MGIPSQVAAVGRPAVAADSEGRLAVFVNGIVQETFSTPQGIYWQHQLTPNGTWSGWESFAPDITTMPMVVPDANGRLVVFAQSSVFNPLNPIVPLTSIVYRYQLPSGAGWDSWSGWSNPPNVTGVYVPAAARNADGRLAVVGVDDQGSVWTRRQKTAGVDDWDNWVSLSAPAGVTLRAGLTVGQNVDGRLEIFARGTNDRIYNLWQAAPSGDWVAGWGELGAPTAGTVGSLGAGHNADGRLEVIANLASGEVWHRTQIFFIIILWSDWATLGKPSGVNLSQVHVAQFTTGEQIILSAGSDKALWAIKQNGPNGEWGPWFSFGKPPAADLGPAASPNWTSAGDKSGNLSIFAAAGDGALWRRDQLRTLDLPLINRAP